MIGRQPAVGLTMTVYTQSPSLESVPRAFFRLIGLPPIIVPAMKLQFKDLICPPFVVHSVSNFLNMQVHFYAP
jgi:hypothetical protein